ncbi:MAG: hypothetical protein JWP01_1856 [Myxococcales bacterium]|nr:hypothetical protein [Myxococcales bacterium]
MSNIIRTNVAKVLRVSAFVAAGVFASACGDDGAPAIDAAVGPDAPAGCTSSNATTMIATNHTHGMHAMVVTSAEVTAGVEKIYDIMGAAGHTHSVTISAADFTMLKAGGTIMVTSSDGEGHTHVVTISCA